jgi:hypothetical protein
MAVAPMILARSNVTGVIERSSSLMGQYRLSLRARVRGYTIVMNVASMEFALKNP